MLEKNFDVWNGAKKVIESKESGAFCHAREVWWCSLGVNVGFEQDGTGKAFDRPVVVIRGFNDRIFFAAALTGRKRTGRYYFPIGTIDGREASVILSQVRLIDSKRLIKKVATLDEEIFSSLKMAMQKALFD